ncbi:hypothetical protein ACNS7O_17555 (plasmid) [Haloferacaceae archaeon DSL9]
MSSTEAPRNSAGCDHDENDSAAIVVLHGIEQAAPLAGRMVALKGGERRVRGTPEKSPTEELLAEALRVGAEVDLTERGPPTAPTRACREEPVLNGVDGLESGSEAR